MSDNPLKRYFRQPSTYLRLPTLGRWYNKNDVQTNEEGELPVYGLSAIDDIMLNTPDANTRYGSYICWHKDGYYRWQV